MPDDLNGHPDDDTARRFAENLRGMADAAGVPQPDEVATAALEIWVGSEKKRPTPQAFTRALVDIVRSRGLYIKNKEVGTVNELTGEFEVMTPHELVTWVPQVAGIVPVAARPIDDESGRHKIIEGDIGVEMARIFLASRELKVKLPVIEHVNLVQLPVMRRGKLNEAGKPTIELLQPGYDAETRTFTCHGGPVIDEEIDPLQAASWLFKIARTFDWSQKDEHGRSDRMAVHFSCMVTAFCRYLFAGKSPFFHYNSNLEGSGKGALVKWALLPVFRRSGAVTLDPSNREELLKILDSKASAGDEYVWADEMPDGILLKELHLARWATSKIWEMRPMGQNKKIDKHDITKIITIISANRVRTDRNIGRRTLIADLFPHQASNERTLPKDTVLLDDEFFEDEENLNMTLSCVWSLVKSWDEAGRPSTKDRPLETFEGWSRVIAPIVEHAGLGRPLAPFEMAGSGDDDSREMKKLAKLIIEQHCVEVRDGQAVWMRSRVVTMKEIVRCARLNNLFTERLWTVDAVLEELKGKHKFKWEKVPVIDPETGEQEIDPLDNKPMWNDPSEEDMRKQAAGWLDQTLGSKWGYFFKKMAVVGHYFTVAPGVVYEFGKRDTDSKGSSFNIERIDSKPQA
jgi:hypothetical protein